MKTKYYDRTKAVQYAEKWAYKRNNKYYNFDNIGGDCTSFISQCIYAGCDIMNNKKYIGWYYNSVNDRSASWSGVEFLYNFLKANNGIGPRGIISPISDLEIGDIVQLKFYEERYSHSLIIVNKTGNTLDNIYVAAHTEDVYYKKVSNYYFEDIRFLHIKNVGIY